MLVRQEADLDGILIDALYSAESLQDQLEKVEKCIKQWPRTGANREPAAQDVQEALKFEGLREYRSELLDSLTHIARDLEDRGLPKEVWVRVGQGEKRIKLCKTSVKRPGAKQATLEPKIRIAAWHEPVCDA